ncbi:2-dehydro-3-deoxygalactonokinase [Salipiger sp.]|uniref:2-dehydro-3-deoxygalactonokinase n=1 Tax=Salipiger sp. TaxID=2078585 RepID=UPI003A96CB2C
MRPANPGTFVAVDWGTSSFRLWVLDGSGRILGESRGPDGMVPAARDGFSTVLARHLDRADAPEGAPVVISGMAGARQGWVETPYLPVGRDLRDLATAARPVAFAGRAVHVLPGVSRAERTRADVMRGEETQVLGLLQKSESVERIVMPGTHSKWVRVKGRVIVDFSTFLTGELFALLTAQSTLASVMEGNEAPGPTGDFDDAVRSALDHPAAALERLFGLRAAGLLGFDPPATLRTRLSGLLIGAEVGLARARYGTGPVTLVAAGGTCALYERALRLAGLAVTPEDSETAARAGLLAAARTLHPEILS